MEILEIFRDAPNARAVPAGVPVFRRGERGDVMYVVLEGRIDVEVDGETIERLEPGSIFGEMALVDDGPRSADAIAGVDSSLAPVDRAWFGYMVKRSPEFGLHVMTVMANRLRRYMSRDG